MKNKFWLENLKMIIASGVIGVIVLGLIYWKFFMVPEHPAGYQYPPPQYAAPPQAPPAPAGGETASDDSGASEDAGGGNNDILIVKTCP